MNKIPAHDVFGKEYLVDKDDLNFSVHIYGIAVKDSKILISPQFDGYDFPGGTAEKGESIEETLVREVKEETGLSCKPLEFLGAYTSFFRHYKTGKSYQSYLIYFKIEITGGEITDAGFDEREKEYASLARWVSIDELKTMRHACSIDISADLIKKATKK